jgi:hypothetical protein
MIQHNIATFLQRRFGIDARLEKMKVSRLPASHSQQPAFFLCRIN